MYRHQSSKYPFGTTSAVYFSTSRDQMFKSREVSEQKQQHIVQHPISQIVYGGPMKFTPNTTKKMPKDLNITLDQNPKLGQSNLMKQREQLEKDWNKILSQSRSLQDNLVFLQNCVSMNLQKKDCRFSKESTQSGQSGQSGQSVNKSKPQQTKELLKVNVSCKLKSPFKQLKTSRRCESRRCDSIFTSIEMKLNLKMGDFLGRGKFSDVYLAVDQRTGLIFALKMIKKHIVLEYEMQEQLGREIMIQSKLNHPNIVKMYGQTYDENYVYMMLEYCNGGEMFKHQYKQPNKRFSEQTASAYIQQILTAIFYMHAQGYMHRDMKTENILLSINQIKICDLGCVREIPQFDQRRTTFCGTVDYIAPEVINDQGYDERCDAWQIAILAYELVNGNTPFAEHPRDDDAIIENILQNKFLMPQNFSAYLKDFVIKGLQPNPEKRIKIQDMLKHPWIVKNSKSVDQKYLIN